MMLARLATAASLLALVACSSNRPSEDAAPTPDAPAADVAEEASDDAAATVDHDREPEPERGGVLPAPDSLEALTERARMRWSLIEAADWIASYDYLEARVRAAQSIGEYLTAADHHYYLVTDGPRAVGRVDDETALVRVVVDWTPTHPELEAAGQDLTQSIAMVETWRFEDGAWWFARAEREATARERHPEVLGDPADGR